MRLLSSGCIALADFLTAHAWAQENSGVLQGTVSDDTDAVLPGVTVTLTNKATNRVLSTSAGAYGNYSFRNVEPGRYSVAFELAGFSRTAYRNRRSERPNPPAGCHLKPGPVTTTIQVVDSAHDRSGELDSRPPCPAGGIRPLPKSRTFHSLAVLAPAYTREIEGGLQINGASGAEKPSLLMGSQPTAASMDGPARMPCSNTCRKSRSRRPALERKKRRPRRRRFRGHKIRRRAFSWQRVALLRRRLLERRSGPAARSRPSGQPDCRATFRT